MRRMLAFALAVAWAFGLAVGVGDALANCGAEHADTAKPTSQQPQPQT
jgi:hypothetical protein